MVRLCTMMAAMLLLSSCTDFGDVSDPLAQWQALHARAYTVDQQVVCFCAQRGDTVRLTVHDGAITAAFRLRDGMTLDSAQREFYRSIEQLFDKALKPGRDSVELSYHPRYGYPAELTINPQLLPVDGGITYRTWNLSVKD